MIYSAGSRKRKESVAGKKTETVKSVNVSLGGIPTGRLALRPDGISVFEYSDQWLQQGFSISPLHLPLRPGLFTAKRDPFDGLFGVFSDSLPDGWGTLLIDRWLRKQGIEPGSLTPPDRLTLVGNNGMGALSYEPEQGLKGIQENPDIDQLALKIQKILKEEGNSGLEQLIRMGESSGGARPKVMIRIEDVDWLIKFPASSDPDGIGALEYQYSIIARQCGINMPETKLFSGKYFGVRRFDRIAGRRIHVHSAGGLFYASFRLPSLDYTSLIKAVMAITADIQEAGKMFRLMVFNVLTGNRDDHAKNFSFLYDDGRWWLSPAYDLVSSYGFNGFHSTTISGSGKPSRSDIFKVAELTGFPMQQARAIFDQVFESCKEIRIKGF
ncbi:MAG: type II toxin-antitoxin system HipA family toxin [Bacteroidales bacterium]